MTKTTIIGLDLAKRVLQAHGADGGGGAVFRKRLSRENALAFLGRQPRCIVAMEACGSAHAGSRRGPGPSRKVGRVRRAANGKVETTGPTGIWKSKVKQRAQSAPK